MIKKKVTTTIFTLRNQAASQRIGSSNLRDFMTSLVHQGPHYEIHLDNYTMGLIDAKICLQRLFIMQNPFKIFLTLMFFINW